jgi:hypothetical protein
MSDTNDPRDWDWRTWRCEICGAECTGHVCTGCGYDSNEPFVIFGTN